MSATIHDFPRVTAALDEMAAGLELVVHNRFPHLSHRTRVVVSLAPGGVDVQLHSLELAPEELAEVQRFLAGITGAAREMQREADAPTPGMRERRRPPQPRLRALLDKVCGTHVAPHATGVVSLGGVAKAS